MRFEEEGKPQEIDPTERDDSLADQALEAIVRSQQLRARSRKLRKGNAPDHSTTVSAQEDPL